MLQKVKQHIARHHLIEPSDHILVTLSGGADSMALLKVLTELNFKVSAAHCNFNLRGEESDADEQFVRNWLKSQHIPAHFIAFNTREYAKEKKLSIEMAARELRYNWFKELCEQHGYTKIATGHHLNDSIETVFLNLARGTGIQGIAGIQAKNGTIIRPLLTVSRTEIEDFLKEKEIPYRHDSSNDSLEYLRNIVRHQIIPEFKKLNPTFENVMTQNLENLSQAQGIYSEQIDLLKKELVLTDPQQTRIDGKKLLNQPFKETLLLEFTKEFGFSFDTIQKALLALEHEPGRIFYSDNYQLLVDRETLIIEPQTVSGETLEINSEADLKSLPFFSTVQQLSSKDYQLIKSNQTGSFDLDKLKFPITIRSWQNGDRFYPLGMKQAKKLSDFFTDQKIDRFQKEKIKIMESAGEIVWIMGYRIDDRFKVTQNTKEVLVLTMKQ